MNDKFGKCRLLRLWTPYCMEIPITELCPESSTRGQKKVCLFLCSKYPCTHCNCKWPACNVLTVWCQYRANIWVICINPRLWTWFHRIELTCGSVLLASRCTLASNGLKSCNPSTCTIHILAFVCMKLLLPMCIYLYRQFVCDSTLVWGCIVSQTFININR